MKLHMIILEHIPHRLTVPDFFNFMTSYSELHTFWRFSKSLRLRHFATNLHATSYDYTRTYSTSTDDARFFNFMTSYSGLHTFWKFLLFSRRFEKILRLRHVATDLHETSYGYTRIYSTSTDDARFFLFEFHEVIIRVANFVEIQKG